MLHPKWFKTLDSKTRVHHISPVFYLFLDIFPYLPYVPAIVDFCLFYRYALSFFLSLNRRFPFAICPFNCPSIHPVCSCLLELDHGLVVECKQDRYCLNAFIPTWPIPVHPFRLISTVISTLRSSLYPQADVFPILIRHFISVIAFNFFIHQDIYCLLCAEYILKLGIL